MVRESYHIFVRVARFVPKDESGERHNPVRYSAFGSRKPSAERQSCRSAPRSGSERASTSSRYSLVARISTDSGVYSRIKTTFSSTDITPSLDAKIRIALCGNSTNLRHEPVAEKTDRDRWDVSVLAAATSASGSVHEQYHMCER